MYIYIYIYIIISRKTKMYGNAPVHAIAPRNASNSAAELTQHRPYPKVFTSKIFSWFPTCAYPKAQAVTQYPK